MQSGPVSDPLRVGFSAIQSDVFNEWMYLYEHSFTYVFIIFNDDDIPTHAVSHTHVLSILFLLEHSKHTSKHHDRRCRIQMVLPTPATRFRSHRIETRESCAPLSLQERFFASLARASVARCERFAAEETKRCTGMR